MTRRTGGVLGVLALSALVAGCHPGVSTDKVAALVATVTHGGATVRKIFPGPKGSGLTGAVVQEGSNPPFVVWIAADGKTLIAGNVFDVRRRNLTELAAIQLAGAPVRARPVPPVPVPAAASGPPSPVFLAPGAYRAMAGGVRFLREGRGKKSLWIFLDPNCIWCHRLYADLGARLLPEDVSVNWVPVAFIKPSSVGRAETLLARGLPALAEDESRFDESAEEGGIPGTRRPDLEAEVKENTQILARILGATGRLMTPTLVYRDGEGRAKRFDGYPMPEILERIAGEAE